ncbi:hypothetical protein [Budvicia aquatica]|uniref:Uncharacterized protein n=1 Tax=Budvicia aquatica TaxID=82979 RepID=A0A484ZGE4_9GAMM|nr:hypothetical protein [Budvicia aquatica]VFS47464.1 Uncharacterised protein [Budvicia aquatica]
MWARIENNRVVELTDINPEGRFHPSLVWVNCPEYVQADYLYDGHIFTEPEEISDIE